MIQKMESELSSDAFSETWTFRPKSQTSNLKQIQSTKFECFKHGGRTTAKFESL